MKRIVMFFILAAASACYVPAWADDAFSADGYEREVNMEMRAFLQKSGQTLDRSTEISWLEKRREALEAQAAKEKRLYNKTGDGTYRNTFRRLGLELDVLKQMIQKRQAKNE